ncbi:hypothetical protein D7Y55_18455 [Stenotrophomonas maltophilia]|nr:hypothetical protein [Stenotrophomonas maltophilia]
MDVSRGIALALTVGMMIALVRLPAHVDGGGIAPNGLGCPDFSPSRALPVTLEALRTDPMRYHGRLVRVRVSTLMVLKCLRCIPGRRYRTHGRLRACG